MPMGDKHFSGSLKREMGILLDMESFEIGPSTTRMCAAYTNYLQQFSGNAYQFSWSAAAQTRHSSA